MDVRFFYGYNHRECDDPCSAALAPAFGGDGHADFTQAASKVGAQMWIVKNFLAQVFDILDEGRITFS